MARDKSIVVGEIEAVNAQIEQLILTRNALVAEHESGQPRWFRAVCPVCTGHGVNEEQPCTRCDGLGYLLAVEWRDTSEDYTATLVLSRIK